jgi:peptidoglycan/LPS O-acetylase OafA/YrhL
MSAVSFQEFCTANLRPLKRGFEIDWKTGDIPADFRRGSCSNRRGRVNLNVQRPLRQFQQQAAHPRYLADSGLLHTRQPLLIIQDSMKKAVHFAAAEEARFRPDIEGLRALAVVSVIINHFSAGLLPGGYLGVDIFFVISGYVISQSLMHQRADRISQFIIGFYVRRIKRLFPALVTVVVVTGLLICMVSYRPKDSLRTGIASLFGMSNLYLMRQATDYFAPSSELNAFTQTWSLGVEEQFYVLYPILLYFGMISTHGRTLRRFLIIVSLLFASSIAVFVVYNLENPTVAYYFMLARFWEIAVGCLAYFARYYDLVPAPVHRWLGRVTLVLFNGIIATLFVSSANVIWMTMAAVGLTGLVLISIVRNSKLYSLLSLQPITYVGKLSYSLYLWHWSILCLSRYTTGISWKTAPFQITLMMICSYLSYFYVENPIRNSQRIPSRFTTILAGVGVSCLAAGLCLVFLNNSRHLFLSAGNLVMPPAFLPVDGRSLPYDPTCVVDADRPLTADKLDKCTIKPKDGRSATIWTLGDSHAGHLQGLLYAVHEQTGVGIFLIETPGRVFPSEVQFAPAEVIYRYVADHLKSGDILLLSRLYLDRINRQPFSDLDTWAKDVAELSESLRTRGVQIVVVGPPPMFGFDDISKCIASYYVFSTCDIDRQSLVDSVNDVYAVLNRQFVGKENVIVFRSFDILCPSMQSTCSPIRNATALFRDKDHLNSVGSAMLAPYFIRFLSLPVSTATQKPGREENYGWRAAPWNGDRIVVASGQSDDRLILVSGFHALETWGCWTDGTRAEVAVDLGADAARRHRLTLSLTALIKKGPQRITASINGDVRCAQIVTQSGPTTLSCELPEGAKGPTKIEISTSYASSPRDWGENDSRDLGVGLRSIELD